MFLHTQGALHLEEKGIWHTRLGSHKIRSHTTVITWHSRPLNLVAQPPPFPPRWPDRCWTWPGSTWRSPPPTFVSTSPSSPLQTWQFAPRWLDLNPHTSLWEICTLAAVAGWKEAT